MDALSAFEEEIRSALAMDRRRSEDWIDSTVRLKMHATRNGLAMRFEKQKFTDYAISLYEENVSDNDEGNHSYERLAILYRKSKRKTDEIRVLEKAVWVFRNVVHQQRGDRAIKLYRFETALARATGNQSADRIRTSMLNPSDAPRTAEIPRVSPMEDPKRWLSNWRLSIYATEPPEGFSATGIYLLSTFYLPRPRDRPVGQRVYSNRLSSEADYPADVTITVYDMRLPKTYMDVIQEWVDKGLLTSHFSSYDVIYYGMRLPELKDVLRTAGLKVSGNKDELVERILEAGQSVTNAALQVCPEMYGCTSAGRAVVDAYLQQKESR